MRYGYKASASAIQALMKTQSGSKTYKVDQI